MPVIRSLSLKAYHLSICHKKINSHTNHQNHFDVTPSNLESGCNPTEIIRFTIHPFEYFGFKKH